jgi:hypothetical protein
VFGVGAGIVARVSNPVSARLDRMSPVGWYRARTAHLLTAMAVIALSAGEGRGRVEAAAQAGAVWPFELEWEQPAGAGAVSEYRICAGQNCRVLAARRVTGTRWRAPLPAYAAGEHRLQLMACNAVACTAGTPDLFIRVSAPSNRRPPIDVLEGPRIPVGR